MLRIKVKEVRSQNEATPPKKKPKIRLLVTGETPKTTTKNLRHSERSEESPTNSTQKRTPLLSKKGQAVVSDTTNPAGLLAYFNQQQSELKVSRAKLSSSIFEQVFGHRNAPTIDIGSVLNEFNNTVDESTNEVLEYDIMFLAMPKETGNAYVREMRARKNVKSPKRQMTERNSRGKQQFNLKFEGIMLLHDTRGEVTRSVKTRMIFAFKRPNEKTWCRVADRSGGWNGTPGPLKQVYNQDELNTLYHSIDDYQPKIKEVFMKIRALEQTGKLPEEKKVNASAALDSLKNERRRLNDLISKTQKKLDVTGKKQNPDKVLEWEQKLAWAKIQRESVQDKIDKLTR
ncbi:hypothetical protein GBO34_00780 [Roseivirga pacifica]|uniref:hypothetical protein n=1 Tax=Roseivirga pacifica TaxID=1267423 RepID=UPI002094B48B|nr:hypothetical protein [Roseivirga pacifica]MCO6367847.1 hypothetical protein [Roseivirga pacifica]MCO6377219.1 hypothetical protein [Roseivirga pacifica]